MDVQRQIRLADQLFTKPDSVGPGWEHSTDRTHGHSHTNALLAKHTVEHTHTADKESANWNECSRKTLSVSFVVFRGRVTFGRARPQIRTTRSDSEAILLGRLLYRHTLEPGRWWWHRRAPADHKLEHTVSESVRVSVDQCASLGSLLELACERRASSVPERWRLTE